MSYNLKGSQCDNCAHQKVCSLTEEFLNAQQAVNNVHVSLGERSMKNLRDFDWIKPVSLECIHFMEKRSLVSRGMLPPDTDQVCSSVDPGQSLIG